MMVRKKWKLGTIEKMMRRNTRMESIGRRRREEEKKLVGNGAKDTKNAQ